MRMAGCGGHISSGGGQRTSGSGHSGSRGRHSRSDGGHSFPVAGHARSDDGQPRSGSVDLVGYARSDVGTLIPGLNQPRRQVNGDDQAASLFSAMPSILASAGSIPSPGACSGSTHP